MSGVAPTAQIEHWLAQGEIQKAHSACLRLLADYPAEPSLVTLLALAEEGLGLVDQAISRLQEVVQAHPNLARAWFHLGRLELSCGRSQEARQALSACIKLEPNHAPSRHLLARLDQQQNGTSEAIEDLKTALMADPTYLPALTDLALLSMKIGQWDEALGWANQAIEAHPNQGMAHLVLGRILVDQGRLEDGLDHVRRATDLDPDDAAGLLLLAELQQRQGDYEGALLTLDRLSGEQKAKADARLLRSLVLLNLSQLRAAVALLSGLEINKASTVFRLLALIDGLTQNQAIEGLATLAHNLDGTSSDLEGIRCWMAALLAYLSGQLDQARDDLEPLLQSPEPSLAARAHLLVAKIALDQKEPEAVMPLLTRLGQPQNLNHHVIWDMAQLAIQAGERAFALACLDNLLGDKQRSKAVIDQTHALRAKLEAAPLP